MIIGVFLRYIKTYQGINYIPLTNGDRFCGLLGNNGVGKSSVLESLDCFFNNRTWNYKIATKKKGKVIFLSDTDAELVRYETPNYSNLIWKRIVNCQAERQTKLVKIDSNLCEPKTEIEDVLNGKLFYEVLISFKSEYPQLLDFVCEEKDISEESSYFALDLKLSEKGKLTQFFDSDNNKYKFAKRYIESMKDTHVVPNWITEIKNIVIPNKKHTIL